MAEKAAKGQKIGRNSRSNSSKLQKQRTEKNKRIRAERHAARMGKTISDLTRAGGFSSSLAYPYRPAPRLKERVVFSDVVPNLANGLPLHLYYSGGVLIEISHRRLDSPPIFSTRTSFEHRVLNAVSGDLRLIDSRPWR
jgi:hypothetical protein